MIEEGMEAVGMVTGEVDSLMVEIRRADMTGMVVAGDRLETTAEVAIVKWAAARAIWVVETLATVATWTGEVETLMTITIEETDLLHSSKRSTRSPRDLSSRTPSHLVPSSHTLSLPGLSNLTPSRPVLSNRTAAAAKKAAIKEINNLAGTDHAYKHLMASN